MNCTRLLDYELRPRVCTLCGSCVAHTTKCRAWGRARHSCAPGSSGGVALPRVPLPVRRRAWMSCPRRQVARARLCHLAHLLGAALARRTRRCSGQLLVGERRGPSPRAVVAPRSPAALRYRRHRTGFRPCCERVHLARPALRPCLTLRARLALRAPWRPRPTLHPRLACGLREALVLAEALRRATRANLVRVGVRVRSAVSGKGWGWG